MGAGDGDPVQVGQQLAEGIEERPVRQQADRLVGVHCLSDAVLLPDVLVLDSEVAHLEVRQLVLGVLLVESDGCTIHLHIQHRLHREGRFVSCCIVSFDSPHCHRQKPLKDFGLILFVGAKTKVNK